MAEFLIGLGIMAGLWVVVGVARNKQLRVPLWGWFLTVIGFGYATFVVMTILAFYREEQYQAILTMGALMAFPGLVLGVFLYRFAFTQAPKSRSETLKQ